ncbi:MAG: hypothetical protein RSC05_08470 [Acinetobacter sp.]|jgi:hypothetical protein
MTALEDVEVMIKQFYFWMIVGCGLFLLMSGFVMRSTFEGAIGTLLILYKTVMD